MKYGTLNPDNLCRVLEGIFSERDGGAVVKVSLSSEKITESCEEAVDKGMDMDCRE